MTVQLRDPAHYLTALKTTSTPQRLLWLDCATVASKEQGMFVERWNGAALGTTHYTSRKKERNPGEHPYHDRGKQNHPEYPVLPESPGPTPGASVSRAVL